MQAKDVMTTLVVTAARDMPAREIARLMSKHGVSGLPVVDGSGAPLGMVSEGDLIGRIDIDREMRRDWWLTLFSETPLLSADSILALAKLFAKLRIRDKRASEILSAPVVAVGETTDVQGKPLLGKAAKESSIAGYCRQCPAVRTRLARGAAV